MAVNASLVAVAAPFHNSRISASAASRSPNSCSELPNSWSLEMTISRDSAFNTSHSVVSPPQTVKHPTCLPISICKTALFPSAGDCGKCNSALQIC